MRFAPKAKGEGIRHLRTSGFKIASTSDFRAAAAVPNDFDGADVQYFERFGIAILRRDPERAASTLQRAVEQKVISAMRAERTYRALGVRSTAMPAPVAAGAPLAAGGPDYLTGYRDGVNQLVDRLLSGGPGAAAARAQQFDETAVTWGLEATKVNLSALSGAGIKIAVLDTGFDETHPEFRGRTVVKKQFATNASDKDMVGHGTHCIGTSCGPLHPTKGPRFGIAYNAEIYAGKVLGDDGTGTDRSIIAGMDWALDQGCQIISMSLGATTNLGDQPVDDYEQIGHACLDAGTLIVAAAGNDSQRPGFISPVGSPANASTILAVAAVDRAMQVAVFSCGGMNPHQDVDIAAPGVDILSTLPGGAYDRWDGTSMATPHVAGIAALIAESDAKYRGWALWTRLVQTARPLGLPARDVGKGLVQAPPK
jgi:subtilisin family serine protease